MNATFLDEAEHHAPYFFGFRLPNDVNCIFGSSDKVTIGISKGFVVAPFNPEKEWFTIPFGNIISDKTISHRSDFSLRSTTKEEHEEMVSEALKLILGSDVLNKIVISRTETINRNFRLSSIFNTLCRIYPESYIFCIGTPDYGIWIGASPELLLEADNMEIRSCALAGTYKVDSNNTWNKKNIIEHNIVREYIAEAFSRNRLNPRISDITEKRAGSVKHLFTSISAKKTEDFDVRYLLRDLSPTPALSGFPKEDSIRAIKNIENHDRLLYGGFSGPVISENNMNLYVNLRSMLVSDSLCQLFIGGGIVSGSDPETEWNETIAKSMTMKNAIIQAG